ncbi:peptidase S8 and S53 subtilisin kexin sedolisin [Pseudopedobacter saltans DSM 12145]|uniref:Peptidase S8 and S53 subtilisin kexin sedolisin n=1 Tax=Pseudopedobacter saltans (strain ATCC 51119 / DSM 12145 / JCM 21818 / CCUG 39354 / LMG 10337 / NBRC 100064 / NCIMB 13643) TaxID=762903 RepID=F0SC41_PSESL|nr:S8 family serine peptidase [Pseudopedobacter saltans]ADY50626.1 peptidase S8 and S53 subtilisin kexin sedolisin [Pseudopedobacter saltans DSM 12145]
MKYLYQIFIPLIAIVTLAFTNSDNPVKQSFTLPENISYGDYLPNTIIVKYKSLPVATLAERQVTSKELSGIEIISMKPVITQPLRTLSYAEQSKIDDNGLNRIYAINYKSKRNIESVINQFLADENVEYAEPSYVSKTLASPNDPFFIGGSQPYLNQVKAPQAWNIQNDANAVVVAVIDTGSELAHPDLAANIFINYNDPINGIDDDGDGYVDNYYGWDFGGASLNSTPDNDPNVKGADADHGVHVSGLVSAVTNNGIGVASIAKNAKLMILKAGVDDVPRSVYYGYQAIIYAADHGVKIINCSWGSNGRSNFEQEVINYAVSKGCLVVAAAGNDGNEVPVYPAAYSGVLAVANVTAEDIRNGGSSYGFHVGISAPGTSILNTTFSGSYGVKSGTSMAAPLVSSAAALVAAKYPNLSGVQIGEILKQSTDDIYSITQNQAYLNKLGTGRLNVEKALSIAGGPALKKQGILIHDETGSLMAQSTATFDIRVKNILSDANDVFVELGSLNANVKVVNGKRPVGFMAEGEEKEIKGLSVEIGNIGENQDVVFYLEYTSSTQNYRYREYFSVPMNRDYINYSSKDLATTITSNGRVGYSDFGTEQGQGFNYKGSNLLYECSLMIGNANNRVSNNTRVDGHADEHFVKVKRAQRKSAESGEFLAESVFNDSNSLFPLSVEVTHRHVSKEDQDFILVEYEVKNTGTEDLNNVYLGLFSDWDIGESDKNITKLSEENRLAYACPATNAQTFGGLRLVTDQKLNYYPMSYMIPGDFLETGDFTIEEKYLSLSSGIAKRSLGDAYANGADIMYVLGAGPFKIQKGESERVAFAFLAADKLDDLIATSQAAQKAYDVWAEKSKIVKYALMQNYPNPVIKSNNPKTTINLELPEDSMVTLKIIDLFGREFKTVCHQKLTQGRHAFEVDMSNALPGIYYGYANFNGKIAGIKIAVE